MPKRTITVELNPEAIASVDRALQARKFDSLEDMVNTCLVQQGDDDDGPAVDRSGAEWRTFLADCDHELDDLDAGRSEARPLADVMAELRVGWAAEERSKV